MPLLDGSSPAAWLINSMNEHCILFKMRCDTTGGNWPDMLI